MPGKPKTPGILIAAAVLLFLYGGLKLMCSVCGGVQTAMLVSAPAPEGPPGPLNFGDMLAGERELAKRIPSYVPVDICYHIANLLLGAAMILAGAGALMLKRSARRLGNSAAAADLFLTLVYLLYTAVVVFPANDAILQEQMQNLAAFASSVSWGTLVFLGLFTLVFCLLIIWFLNARKARDAFAGKFEPEPHEELLARFDALNEDDDFRRPRPTSPNAPGDAGIKDKPD